MTEGVASGRGWGAGGGHGGSAGRKPEGASGTGVVCGRLCSRCQLGREPETGLPARLLCVRTILGAFTSLASVYP